MALSPRFALTLLACTWLAACSAPTAETPAPEVPLAAAAQPRAPEPAADAAVPAIKGRSYADARTALLAAGWSPLPSPSCTRDVFGELPADRCTTTPDAAECTACTDMPELESCSGSGLCLMRFTHAGRREQLHVTTYGAIAERHARDGGLLVQAHELVVPTN